MKTIIYNCKKCKSGKRVDYPLSRPAGATTLNYRLDHLGKVRTPGISIRFRGPQRLTLYSGDPLGICVKCNRMMDFGALRGSYNEDVKCNAKCSGARGHDCVCSCGGKNHGIGWN